MNLFKYLVTTSLESNNTIIAVDTNANTKNINPLLDKIGTFGIRNVLILVIKNIHVINKLP